MFAQFDTLHDTFKGVDYLYAPTGGVGYNAIDTQRTTFEFDAGVGAVLEKDTGFDPKGSGAGTFGQKVVYKLSDSTTLKESWNSIFKENDLADWLYAFDVGATAKDQLAAFAVPRRARYVQESARRGPHAQTRPGRRHEHRRKILNR
jgi:hypothetical protein